MNEQRLTEFGEQALEYAHANYIAGSDPHQWNVLYRKKFAELIIRECGVALSPMLRDMVSRGQAFDLIKQHFGIEE